MLSILEKVFTALSLFYKRWRQWVFDQANVKGVKQITESKGDDDDVQGLKTLRDNVYGGPPSDQPK